MEWIYFKDILPERDQEIIVYKSVPMGGYAEGIYTAMYVKEKFFGGSLREYIILREDLCTNRNNYRSLKEFISWMPFPNQPERLSEKTP